MKQLTGMMDAILEGAALDVLSAQPDFPALEAQCGAELRPLLHRKPVRTAIEAIYQLPFLERVAVYRAFCNDIAFDRHIADEAYRLSRLSDLSPEGAEALKNLGTNLYDLVSGGFPGTGTELFSSRLLRARFQKENGAFGRVCPVCIRDVMFVSGEGDGDHYFPKASYPALALHEHNLIPTCSDCNQRYKGKKEPVDPRDAGEGELRTVFLPYLRPAQQEVELTVEGDRIVMKPGPGADGWTGRRIENMDRLYQLSERWSDMLGCVVDDMKAEARQQYEQGKRGKDLLDALRGVMRAAADSTRNRADRRDMIKGVYCGWLQSRDDEILEEILSDFSLWEALPEGAQP